VRKGKSRTKSRRGEHRRNTESGKRMNRKGRRDASRRGYKKTMSTRVKKSKDKNWTLNGVSKAAHEVNKTKEKEVKKKLAIVRESVGRMTQGECKWEGSTGSCK